MLDISTQVYEYESNSELAQYIENNDYHALIGREKCLCNLQQDEFIRLIDIIISNNKKDKNNFLKLKNLYSKLNLNRLVINMLKSNSDINEILNKLNFIKNFILNNSCFVSELICQILKSIYSSSAFKQAYVSKFENKSLQFCEFFKENNKMFCRKKILNTICKKDKIIEESNVIFDDAIKFLKNYDAKITYTFGI